MNNFEYLRTLFNSFINKRKPRGREMKRVFQWRRYLEWKDLTPDEKISAKRFLLIPVFAYLIIQILNENFYLIILLLMGYVLYKKFEKDSIIKK